jgi:cobalt-zinc-cadmium efflux system protein
VFLFGAVGAVAWEAVRRFQRPGEVDGVTVAWVAAIGIVVNALTAFPFLKGAKKDLNLRAAFLHLVADAAVSAGVLVTGLVIARTGATWLDPVISLAISAVILYGTWGVLRDSLNLALSAVPSGVDIGSVRGYLAGLPEVEEVHDLHIWGMSTTETALTAHLVLRRPLQGDRFLKRVLRHLDHEFGIPHATLQLEVGGSSRPAPPGGGEDLRVLREALRRLRGLVFLERRSPGKADVWRALFSGASGFPVGVFTFEPRNKPPSP